MTIPNLETNAAHRVNIAGGGRTGILPSHDKFIGKIPFRTGVACSGCHARTPFIQENPHETEVAYLRMAGIIN